MMAKPERDVVPGLFELNLPINTVENIDKKVVTAKLRELEDDVQARLGRPEELAIRNLLGVFSFRIGDYEDAISHFDDVLSKDPENLNALVSQQFVMEQLRRMVDAQSLKDRHEGLMQLGDAPSDERLKQRRCLKARCLAEQGYAFACDIHIDRLGETRYIQANYLYEDAFKLAGDLVEPLEKDNWKFCMAKNAHKIFDFLAYKEEFADEAESLKDAETLFFELTQSIPGDPEFKWESWRHLADIIRGIIKRKEFKNFAFRPELKEYKEDPEKCMTRAMEISPDNPKLLARYANFVYSLKKKDCFKRAMDMVKQSMEIDSSESNFYAYSIRARLAYKQYKFYLANFKQGRSKSHPAARHLENAKQDFETGLSMRETPWDFSYLGEVHYLLAKHPKYDERGREIVRQHVEKAMLYFRKSVDCQDGGSRPIYHRVWGQCLFDMGEYDAAKDCFLKAVKCEPEGTSFSGIFTEVLQVYLHLLQQEKPIPLENWSMLGEVLDKLKSAQVKYGKNNLEKHTVSKLNSNYLTEIQMIAEYCKRFPLYSDLVPLLTSVTQKPPFSLPLSTGGTLEQSWKAPIRGQQHTEPKQDTSSTSASTQNADNASSSDYPALTSKGDAAGRAEETSPSGRSTDDANDGN